MLFKEFIQYCFVSLWVLFIIFRFVDIANSNLKIQYVVFAKQRRICGCVLSVGLLAAEGMDCISCYQHRDMFPSRLSKVIHFSLLNTWRRYKEGHARRHWEETEHCYSLELETQRVWDYAGDNYVHRLIQSKTDGKLVELNSHGSLSKDGCGSCEYSESGMTDALLNSKVDMVVLAFHVFVNLVFNFCILKLI